MNTCIEFRCYGPTGLYYVLSWSEKMQPLCEWLNPGGGYCRDDRLYLRVVE